MTNKYTTTTRRNPKEETLYCGILSATVGYREKSQGVKLLKNVGSYSILEHQLNVIRHVEPHSHCTITVGFQADKVIRSRPQDISIIENVLYEQENTAEEVRLLLNSINPAKLLLIDGPVLFTEEELRKLIDSASVLVCESDDINQVGVQEENGLVSHFYYGLEEKWSGLVYLEGNALEAFKKIVTRENSKLLLHELLDLLVRKGVSLKVKKTKLKIERF